MAKKASSSGSASSVASNGNLSASASRSPFNLVTSAHPLDFGGSPDTFYHGNAHALLDALWITEAGDFRISALNHAGENVKIVVRNALDAAGRLKNVHNWSFSCAAYSTSDKDGADVPVAASSFRISLPCGLEAAATEQGYLDSFEALLYVNKFFIQTEIPQPTHLVMGWRRLDCYWATKQFFTPTAWARVQLQLCQVAQRYGLFLLPAHESEIHSMMPLPGVRAYGGSSRFRSELWSTPNPRDLGELVALIDTAHAESLPSALLIPEREISGEALTRYAVNAVAPQQMAELTEIFRDVESAQYLKRNTSAGWSKHMQEIFEFTRLMPAQVVR